MSSSPGPSIRITSSRGTPSSVRDAGCPGEPTGVNGGAGRVGGVRPEVVGPTVSALDSESRGGLEVP
jgi:hypothetical protein